VIKGIWSSGDTLLATINDMGVVMTKSAGTVPVSYTVSDGCGIASAVISLSINALPGLRPIIGRSVIATGNTATLRGRSPLCVWSSSDTAIATVDQWGEVSGIASGTAIITYSETNSNNCTAIETLQVYVMPSAEVEFSVYPVPATHTLNVAYKMATDMDADVQFTDIMGRVICKSKISTPSSSGLAQFDVSFFPAGIYTISIIAANGNYIGRVVVSH